ncbi:acyltransferase family protein [Glacieibacterium megasporae]|uniref:acyltransferase family protein n=1 Tax=Glacieibacterium megasporae TaxID=2835787 RepID=UPI001C1E4C1C|nr:acyltransferase [Polymorphobacter megasporae]UAJ10172.1 acyltransferase [Polymorphobacter megasporae]
MGKRTSLFDYLRLGGAIAVLVGHSYVLTNSPVPTIGGIGPHGLGVMLFFAISGYLITGSWRADPNIARYAEKRARRIMPALIVVVLATALLLGPVLSNDPTYAAGAWRYIWRNLLLLPLHVLPGVFTSNPLPAVNGSLWTLPVEAFMYVLTPLLVRAGPWACAAAAVALILHPFTQNIAGFGLAGASGVIPYFLGGASLKMLGVKVPDTGLPKLPVDLSYGLYLTAFPVQQTIIALYPHVTPPILIAATLAVCVPLAWASWTFVEKPALTSGASRASGGRLGFRRLGRDSPASPSSDQASSKP